MRMWVFSGGGARISQQLGLVVAHVDAGGKLPDRIVGSSAGAILAHMISNLGVTGARDRLLEIKSRSEIFRGGFLNLFADGYYSSATLKELLTEIGGKPKIPYTVCAYDLTNLEKYYVNHTAPNIIDMIVASASIPGVVQPHVDNRKRRFVDGGTVDNVPLKHAIKSGAKEISVFMASAQTPVHPEESTNILKVLSRSYEAIRMEIMEGDIKVCLLKNKLPDYRVIDLKFYYPSTDAIGVLEFSNLHRGYLAGYNSYSHRLSGLLSA